MGLLPIHPDHQALIDVYAKAFRKQYPDKCYEDFKNALRRKQLTAEEYEILIAEYCRRVGI